MVHEDLRQSLTDRGVALCLADRRGPITPIWRTADWTYLRFHAGGGTPRSCYEGRELVAWAERIEAAWGRAASGFVFLNNDGNGCALRDASVFAHVLDRRGDSVASLPVVSDAVLVDPGGRAPALGKHDHCAGASPRSGLVIDVDVLGVGGARFARPYRSGPRTPSRPRWRVDSRCSVRGQIPSGRRPPGPHRRRLRSLRSRLAP